MSATTPGGALATVLVDELVRCGVRHACLAPGSRSAPLALALAADSRIRLHVLVDERSASFLALGIAKVTRRPVPVVSTSGTAAANFHPAVIEAHHSRTPLLVLTADRPPELRGTGANQTIDQLKLFGDAVRLFAEVGVAEARDDAVRSWRALACRAVAAARGSPAGPVHLNLSFREPLVPGPDAPTFPFELGGRAGGLPWTEVVQAPRHLPEDELEELAAAATSAERGLIVAGDAPVDADAVHALARSAGWPVVADPLSAARCGDLAISTAEALLRHPGFAASHRPDLVLRLGRSASSRTLAAFLDPAVPQMVIDPDASWADPERAAGRVVVADPSAACEALAKGVAGREGSSWLRAWLDAEAAARAAIDALLDGWDEPSEPRVARDLCGALPDGSALVVASSMPVREVDWFMRPRRGLRVTGNRGASGIDGFVSTALGVALAHDGPTAALAGDISLVHDQNGLQLGRQEPVDCVLVVLNNDGGAIFSFLPYAGMPEFERLFGTPHGIDPADIARTFGCGHTRVERMGDLPAAVRAAFDAGGVRIVEIRTDRAANVEHHRRLWAAVAAALERG